MNDKELIDIRDQLRTVFLGCDEIATKLQGSDIEDAHKIITAQNLVYELLDTVQKEIESRG